MADTLQDVVQHVTDGAVAQGYLTPDQAREAVDAASRGERPDLDLANAPVSVRDAAQSVLDQAQTQHQADAQRAEQRADLTDRWADHKDELDELRSDANGMKRDLDALEPVVSSAEAHLQEADRQLGGQPTLAAALVNDVDLASYQADQPRIEETIRPHLDEAIDGIADAREGLIDVNERLIDGLQRADRLEGENDALWGQENAMKADDAAAGRTWTVLEGQADDAVQTHADNAAQTSDAGRDAHVEPAHIEAAPHAEEGGAQSAL